jgi:hypothetical protein
MHQLFISKDFETSLLTLLGVSLVLWRRKADNALSNPCFMALPLNFTTSAFPILNYFTSKIFVRSRRDWKEKNARKDPDIYFSVFPSSWIKNAHTSPCKYFISPLHPSNLAAEAISILFNKLQFSFLPQNIPSNGDDTWDNDDDILECEKSNFHSLNL